MWLISSTYCTHSNLPGLKQNKLQPSSPTLVFISNDPRERALLQHRKSLADSIVSVFQGSLCCTHSFSDINVDFFFCLGYRITKHYACMIIINIILGHFYTNVSSDEQEKRSITNKGHQHTSKLNHYIYSTSLSSSQKRDQPKVYTHVSCEYNKAYLQISPILKMHLRQVEQSRVVVVQLQTDTVSKETNSQTR